MTEPRTERFLEYPPQKGGLVELKDGRLMGIIRGMLKFYSEDRGITWSEPEPVLDNGEQIIAEADPVGVLRLQSGAIGVTSYRPVRGMSCRTEARQRPAVFVNNLNAGFSFGSRMTRARRGRPKCSSRLPASSTGTR